MLPSEVLGRARALLAPKGAWTRGTGARDAQGNAVVPWHSEACSWCMNGAVDAVSENPSWYCTARLYLARALGRDLGGIVDFNDHHLTTHGDVLNVFDRAIRLAKWDEMEFAA